MQPLAFGVAADQLSMLVWSAGVGAGSSLGEQHHLSILSLKPDMVGVSLGAGCLRAGSLGEGRSGVGAGGAEHVGSVWWLGG